MDCKIEACKRPVFARGVCRKHYDAERRLEAPPCGSPGCSRPAERDGMCDPHYRAELAKRSPRCSVPACDGHVVANGMCSKHNSRLKKHGTLDNTRSGDWGAREEHPLYQTWHWHKRGMPRSMIPEWAGDFWTFVDAVCDKPEGHILRRKDRKAPIGPENWVWKETHSAADRAEYARHWRATNKEASRNNDLKKNFGITKAQYDAMEHAQGGVCAICSRPPTGRYKNLSVDHCHATGRVRGLLCSPCNTSLGHFRDDVGVLARAIAYLKTELP